MIAKSDIKKITDYIWEIPKSYRGDMRVPGRFYASEKMLEDILSDNALEQVVNVATVPGIYKYSLAMPDIHWGYGAPVGGVFAVDVREGIISPGATGYDINCGVRLLSSKFTFNEAKPYLETIATNIFQEVPSGVGRSGRLRLNDKELDGVLTRGAKKVVADGYGVEEDLEHLESGGVLETADPLKISSHAKNRGRDQLGTMGAGNHFVEVQRIDAIFDSITAEKLGLFENQVCIMIHTGSRGFGHQAATDYIKTALAVMPKYGIELPDRQLAGAPVMSKEGKDYFAAMSAAANFAWANRQLITWEIRKAWREMIGNGDRGLEVVYDVAHNLAKFEEYDGKKLLVHRKGATRSFPGQPVLIPGSMGTASFVLVGQEKAMKESFGSSCHGAGRRMSRTQAKKIVQGRQLKTQLEDQGIVVRAGSLSGLAEEAPIAYKDIESVVDAVHNIGIAKKVARLRPLAVIKG